MSSVAEIIADLRRAQHGLDEAIGVASRARHQVETATTNMKYNLAGTSNRNAMASTARWNQAHKRLDRLIGRMLTASRDIDRYIAAIAPGAGTPGVASVGQSRGDPGDNPSEAGDRGSRLDRFRRQTVQNADGVTDGAKEITSLVERGVTGARGGPAGGTASGTTPAAAPSQSQPSASAPDIVAGLVAGTILIVEGARAAWRYIRRKETRANDRDE